LVFSAQLKNHLIKTYNILPERISEFPFIIDEKYSHSLTRKRKELIKLSIGLRLKSKIILIIGGADGIPRGKKIVDKLLSAEINAEIVMVCGRNQALYKKVNKLKTQRKASNLHVFGYVDYVYELLSISDLVITKCGASTFMEVLHCGKIPLINSYLWEQEKGNVDYICEKGVGIYEKNTNKIPLLISDLMNNESNSDYFKRNLLNLKLTNGTPEVSKYILKFQN